MTLAPYSQLRDPARRSLSGWIPLPGPMAIYLEPNNKC